MSREHSFGGEERHLGVIGDGSQFSVGGGVVAYSLFAISADNFVQVQKFDGSAESVANGAAEQASSEAGSYARIRRNPGKGHFSVEVQERRLLVKQDTAISAKFSQSNRESPASHGGNSFLSRRELIKGQVYELGAEHESRLCFQSDSIDRVCGDWPTGRCGGACTGSIGAYSGGALAARPRNWGECAESGTAARAAHDHSWRLEVQPGR